MTQVDQTTRELHLRSIRGWTALNAVCVLLSMGCVTQPTEVNVVDIPVDIEAMTPPDAAVAGRLDAHMSMDISVQLGIAPVEPNVLIMDALIPMDQPMADQGTDTDVPPPPPPPPPRDPIITELMTGHRNVIRDENGRSSDWIEIFNPHTQEIDLDGYGLTTQPDAPAAWRFPSRTLASGEYLVVFASGDDQRDPMGTLHTSFTLQDPGEHLAFSRPDGTIFQVLSDWSQENDDLSFGIAMESASRVLLSHESPLRYRLPSDDSVDEIWTDPNYDDERWAEGRFPLGFDNTPFLERGQPLANSVRDWSRIGEQGAQGWSYGYWNRSTDNDDRYTPDEFIPFPSQGDTFGPENFWNGRQWSWFQGDPPWTSVHERNMHPNGVNNGAEHWPMRRWENNATSGLVVHWVLRKSARGSAGITGYVMQNGEVIDQQGLDGRDGGGIRRDAAILRAEPGDVIDFVLSPIAPNGDTNDYEDRTAFTAEIYESARLDAERGTLLNINEDTSVYIRSQFDVEPPLEPGGQAYLRLQYDDGVIVYLNGETLQTENEPAMLGWDARAQRDRPATLSRTIESYPMAITGLHPRDNHLAIHVLPAPRDDGRLWIAATIEYVFAVLLENDDPMASGQWMYTQFNVPTPGAPNVALE